MECLGTTEAYIYRAWFENQNDSLPRRSSMNDPSLAPYALMDSVYATGNPNRPDTLYGTDPVVLVRDGSGRVVLMRSMGTSKDSTVYRYDTQGRLTSRISAGTYNTPDTLLFLYSWNDATGIRPAAVRFSVPRIIGRDLELDLLSPDHVRVDILGLDGKHLATVSDRILPAGRMLLSLPARLGGLVRVRTSRGESILRRPTL